MWTAFFLLCWPTVKEALNKRPSSYQTFRLIIEFGNGDFHLLRLRQFLRRSESMKTKCIEKIKRILGASTSDDGYARGQYIDKFGNTANFRQVLHIVDTGSRR